MTEGIVDLLNARARLSAKAVVLAGGRGTRLSPYTSVLPKPLMPVGDQSILELLLSQLKTCGISNVTLCVGYLSHLIRAVIGDKTNLGVDITYVVEPEALGTAGPLRLVPGLDSTFVVMNGDVLTTLDFNHLIAAHKEQGNLVTIATYQRLLKIDYGVLRVGSNGSKRVLAYHEKPEMTSAVSMGIYVLEPAALHYIPDSGYFDFPDLVQALLKARQPVGSYPFDGVWFDIGRRDDYERAVATWLGDDLVNESGVAPTSETRLAAS